MRDCWRIELFGGVRACRGDAVLEHFRTQKTASLLAYLAYWAGRSHSREKLIAAFWPDDDLASARHKLSVALHALRQQLEPESPNEGAVLVADRFAVRLAPDAVTTDVAEFAAALDAAERGGSPADRMTALARATDLYRGELLAGYYDSWIFPEQQQLGDRFARALVELVRLREAAGDAAGAIRGALRGVAVDPLREELHQEVIRLYLEQGQPAEALRHYRALEERLRDDLDMTPGPATRALAARARERGAAPSGPPSQAPPPAAVLPVGSSPRPEPPGGAVPLGSPFYVERPTDGLFCEALARGDSIVLVKGPRQVGKTSLLARGIQQAREAGISVALTDLQRLNADHLTSAETLYHALAEELCEQLDLEVCPADAWEPRRGPSPNFRRYVRSQVLGARPGAVVWALDEVDRLFTCPFAPEVFGLFRSWHNERALDPTGPWGRLTLAIAYATEAHLFITDLNQSPFNVGTRLSLGDFDAAQVAELNRRCGSPLESAGEVRRLHELLGGHPYLVRSALYGMVTHPTGGAPLAWVEAQASQDEGLFAEHLRRILLILQRDPELCEAVRDVLRGRPCPSLERFHRLRSAGVLSGDSLGEARPRCALYAQFLSRHLL